jgi:hypothetical protein
METHEALEEATEFLKEFSVDRFWSDEALIAAAILWGERLGIQRTRSAALQVIAEARDKLRA